MALAAWGSLTVWRLYPYFGIRQTLWSIIAVSILILGLRLPGDLEILRRYKYVWLTSGLLLTGLTVILGTNPSGIGPRMWLGCCGVYFQPSEPLKVLLITYLAAYLAGLADIDHWTESRDGLPTPHSGALLPLVAPTILMTGLAMIVLIVQRDLGTAFIFLFLYAAILYLTTGQKRILVVAGVGLVSAGLLGYALFDVVRLRVEAWLNPWLDPSGRSYQIVQSLLAIANGGLFGRGPGMGSPEVVPIPHSDFIYTSLVEETGLVGALGLLILLAIFAFRGLRIALRAQNNFHRYLAAGLTTYLVAQSILIIGGNTRLLPLTGVTLPFISYGGSSLLTAFVTVLLLLHISNQAAKEPHPQPKNAHLYLQLAGFFFISLTGIAFVTGWWAYYRGPDLLSRTDNPRRAIADLYVQRGAILDRNNHAISSSSGSPGEYQRSIYYPALSPVVGYTHPVYGQAGLEATQDDYLRGLRANPTLTTWWNHILYGQPPPGLDVRTTLDLDYQQLVDKALGENAGAAVLINATSGEILAMASHPGFDANLLDETWSDLIQDDRAPLLNRASLGRYPSGDLSKVLFPEGLDAFGLDQPLQMRLPTGDPPNISETEPNLSPLHTALIGAALSAEGVRPAPQFVSAVNTPSAGWVLLPRSAKPINAIQPALANDRARSLIRNNDNYWEHIAEVGQDTDQPIIWYVGGTIPGGSGPPLALALVFENGDQTLAAAIGRRILETAIR